VNYYEQRERKAAAMLAEALALPVVPEDGIFSDGECFVPWNMFPSLYGTYSKAFDDLAIEVLTDIRDGTYKRTDLAAEMFRELLCTTGLCDYGTSPRVCFASEALKKQLPELIHRWTEYSRVHWRQ